MPNTAPLLEGTLSIVLPCFDEAANVAGAVLDAQRAARTYAVDHEVIVVDDGSTDETAAVAQTLAAQDDHVHLVRHEVNRGYGAAVRTGIDASHGDWVLLTDGDRQFDLFELADLIPLSSDHELVAGYRIARADPAHRRAAAHAWNLLQRHTFKVGVRDVDCAFKLVRGDALRGLPLESEGAMISTELVVRAQLAGWGIAEHGVHHRARQAGQATGGDPLVIARALRERVALRRRLQDEQTPAAPRRVAIGA